MIKRKYKIDYKNYIDCSYILFESDLIHYEEINDLSEYEMYNSLYMNNIFFLNNKTTKEIFIGKFIIDINSGESLFTDGMLNGNVLFLLYAVLFLSMFVARLVSIIIKKAADDE